MLKQSLQQKLLQKLSPQQIQFIKLLQIPTVMLDSRIKEELEENPALEDGSLSNAEEVSEYSLEDEENVNNEERTEEEFNIDDYLQDEDQDDGYKMMNDNDSDEDDKKEIPFAVSSSFHETLLVQLSLCVMDDHQFMVAQQILGSLDDDGYLLFATRETVEISICT